MGVLDDILAAKRDEVALLREPRTRSGAPAPRVEAPPIRDFQGGLRRADGRLAVIGEVKRRSPSKGALAPDLEPGTLARSYEAGGAAAVSVLTDERWFGGSLEDLAAARAATSLPVLRKDFLIDPVQLDESRSSGADAILLIAAALEGELLAGMHAHASALGLSALVEVHDEAEIESALAAGAMIVGVNSRNLQTFSEDLSTAERLVAYLPGEVLAVAESAVRDVAGARRMAAAGFDAVLVGEALVRSEDPESLVRALGAARVSPRR